ncbi:7403_t:CDS:1, partial [Paraglomus occultum]
MSTASSSFPNLDTPDRSHTPDYTRKTTRHLSQFDPDTTALWGLVLLLGTYIVFVVSMYAIVVSKLVPETGNK